MLVCECECVCVFQGFKVFYKVFSRFTRFYMYYYIVKLSLKHSSMIDANKECHYSSQ